MIKLLNLKLAIPILMTQSKVTHTAPRKPTVFERLIITLSKNKSYLNDYNYISLSRIFTEILSIPDADEIVRHAFDNLINLQILEGYYDDLNLLTLQDINLQDNSSVRYLLKNGQIPAQPKEDIVKSYYHPVRKELVNNINFEYREEHVIPTIPKELVENFYPDKLIRESLNPNKYTWLSSSSEIIEIVEIQDERGIGFSDIEIDLAFDRHKIILMCHDQMLINFISCVSVATRFKLFESIVYQYNKSSPDIDEVVSDHSLMTEEESLVFMGKQLNIRRWTDAVSKQYSLAKDKKILICDDSPYFSVNLPKDKSLLIVDVSNNIEPKVEWSNQIATVYLPGFSLPPGVKWLQGNIFHSKMEKLQFAKVQLRDVDGQKYILNIAGESELEPSDEIYRNLIKNLNELTRYNSSLELQNIRAFLIPGEKLWQEWLSQPLVDSVSTSLNILVERFRLLTKINDKSPGNMLKDLFKWLKNNLEYKAPFSANELKEAAELAQLIGLQDKNESTIFLEWLLSNSKNPVNYLDLDLYVEAIKPLGKLMPSSPWLSEDVLESWISACGDSNFVKILDYLPIAETLNNLHESLFDLQECFSESWSGFIKDKNTRDLLINKNFASTSHEKYIDKLRSYKNRYNKYIQVFSTYSINLGNESDYLIEQVREAVNSYLDEVSKPDFILESAIKVYAADSCALVKYPDLPNQLKKGEILLIPQRVHEELDNLKGRKKNRAAALGARNAIKGIKNNIQGNIITIDADATDFERLPDSYSRSKADNQILSAILKYDKYNPVFLTDDNNFINKARSLNILSLSLDDYLKGNEPSTELGNAVKNLG